MLSSVQFCTVKCADLGPHHTLRWAQQPRLPHKACNVCMHNTTCSRCVYASRAMAVQVSLTSACCKTCRPLQRVPRAACVVSNTQLAHSSLGVTRWAHTCTYHWSRTQRVGSTAQHSNDNKSAGTRNCIPSAPYMIHRRLACVCQSRATTPQHLQQHNHCSAQNAM